jgi:outer membrane biosynthesis protein TonB
MFETIGRDVDDEANRRKAQSVLLSLAGMAAVTGFVLGLTAYTAVDRVLEPPVDVEMFDLVLVEPDSAPALPGLPPPPPAAAKAEVETPVDTEPEPDPDTTPETLTEPVTEVIQTASRPMGKDGGVDGGDPDGEDGGKHGGVPGGTGDGDGGGADPRVFHHSELQPKKRVQPDYPEGARALSLGDQRCKAVVTIDEEGVPTSVVVQDCPTVFHTATKEALFKWRWYAPKDGRRKVSAQTVIAITYTLR